MSLSNVQPSERVLRLQGQIRDTILSFTMVSPMDPEEVIAVLGFMTGAAVANAPKRNSLRDIRQMAVANLDNGILVYSSGNAGLILPPGIKG